MKGDSGFVMADALVALLCASAMIASLLSVNALSGRSLRTASGRLNAAMLTRGVLDNPSIENEFGETAIGPWSCVWKKSETDLDLQNDLSALLRRQTVSTECHSGTDTAQFSLSVIRLVGDQP